MKVDEIHRPRETGDPVSDPRLDWLPETKGGHVAENLEPQVMQAASATPAAPSAFPEASSVPSLIFVILPD
jgi:hypothetical protein